MKEGMGKKKVKRILIFLLISVFFFSTAAAMQSASYNLDAEVIEGARSSSANFSVETEVAPASNMTGGAYSSLLRVLYGSSQEAVPSTVPSQDVAVIVSTPSGGASGGGGGALPSNKSMTEDIVRLNITLPNEILNVTHNAMLPVEVIVENLGTQKVTNISIIPLLDSRWNYTSASLDIIEPGERQKRTFGILPFDTVETKVHVLPVGVYVGGSLYQIVYLVVDVKPAIPPYARLKIMEYEYSIHLQADSERVMSYLVKNTGTLPLTNITTRLENFESCFQSVRYGAGENYLKINQTAIIDFRVKAASSPNSCNITLISVSSEGGIDMKTIEVFVEEGRELFESIISGFVDFFRWLFELIMEVITAATKSVSSLILLLLTIALAVAMLILYLRRRKKARKREEKNDIESILIRLGK